jgi:hypothetical protein
VIYDKCSAQVLKTLKCWSLILGLLNYEIG